MKTIKTKQAVTAETNNISPLVGRIFTAPDGTEWHVERAFNAHARARKVSAVGYGETQKITTVAGWREHTLPESLKKGDILMYHGEPVKVTSFSNLGGQICASLMGRWGFADGHTHENLVPLHKGMIHEGYRLPFEGESTDVPQAPTEQP